MFQFFKSIASIFDVIVNFIVNLVQALINLIGMILKGFVFIFAIIPTLPPFTIAVVTVTICMAVLINVLNKGS